MNNKLVTHSLAFVFGGLITFFVTDYIQLKSTSVAVNDNEEIKVKKDDRVPLTKHDDLRDQLREKARARARARRQQDPFDRIDQIKKRMDKVFGGSMLGAIAPGMDSGVEIEYREDADFKYVDIIGEGLDQENLKIDIRNGMVHIKGEIEQTNQGSSFFSSFSNSFNIPIGVDETKVTFEAESGKIVLKFPKI